MKLLCCIALVVLFAGASGCSSPPIHVTGYFPEISLVPPDAWPDLQISSNARMDAQKLLHYSYVSYNTAEDVSFFALVTLDSSGAVLAVQEVSAKDEVLRNKIAAALTSLSFYLRAETTPVATPLIANSARDVQTPPLAQEGRARSLPEEMKDVRLIVKYIYRDYWDRGPNKWH